MNAFIILPDQLFYTTTTMQLLNTMDTIYIVEEPLYFDNMHKSKIVLHRSSMKYYEALLKNKINAKIIYISRKKIITNFIDFLSDIKLHMHMFYPASIHSFPNLLHARFNGIKIRFFDNPMFLLSYNFIIDNYKPGKSYNQTAFYIKMRKVFTPELNPLHGKIYKPIGNKWTFDEQNRANFSTFNKDINFNHIPTLPNLPQNTFWDKNCDYYRKINSLKYSEVCRYPITHEEAKTYLQHFMLHNLKHFGKYQDVVHSDNPYLFHSVLSSSLNIGLLTPSQIIHDLLAFIHKHNIPINSYEGFLRQIIGWREYMRMIYTVNNNFHTMNHFNHDRELSEHFYNATTGIIPVDNAIKIAMKTGYLHHIYRLMILSNFFNLQLIKPTSVYKWFMECFVDSYPWVMYPNVIGMGLFADAGLTASRIYISSSAYLKKMTNFTCIDTYNNSQNKAQNNSQNNVDNWCSIWDALYYAFIAKHKTKMSKIYIASGWVKNWNNKNKKEQNDILELAKKYYV